MCADAAPSADAAERLRVSFSPATWNCGTPDEPSTCNAYYSVMASDGKGHHACISTISASAEAGCGDPQAIGLRVTATSGNVVIEDDGRGVPLAYVVCRQNDPPDVPAAHYTARLTDPDGRARDLSGDLARNSFAILGDSPPGTIDTTARITPEGACESNSVAKSGDQCSDGVDNDRDGGIDRTATGDLGCADASSKLENSPPVAQCDSYFVRRGATLRVPARKGLLANDYDPDGYLRSIQITKVSFARKKLTLNPRTGAFTYRATEHEPQRAQITYLVVDSLGAPSKEVTSTIAIGTSRRRCGRRPQGNNCGRRFKDVARVPIYAAAKGRRVATYVAHFEWCTKDQPSWGLYPPRTFWDELGRGSSKQVKFARDTKLERVQTYGDGSWTVNVKLKRSRGRLLPAKRLGFTLTVSLPRNGVGSARGGIFWRDHTGAVCDRGVTCGPHF